MTNPNGYDFTLGSSGFRFATDNDHPYQRYTEPVTAQRFDDSKEPGEQSLSALPWVKSQASFHAGAGQLNLEQGYTDFQYQQEQVSHLRYDTSLGVDVWTPGKVTRLPDTLFTEAGFGPRCAVTASINSVDYAIVGGAHGLCQMKWDSGPDAAPTVTQIDLTGPDFAGATNCNFTAITTDGVNYYALCQLESATTSILTRTYIIKGQVTDTGSPEVLYDVPSALTTDLPTRTNLIKNPSWENNSLVPWKDTNGTTVNMAVSTDQALYGTHSMKLTDGATALHDPTGTPNRGQITVSKGDTFTFSFYYYKAAGSSTTVNAVANLEFSDSAGNNSWTYDTWNSSEVQPIGSWTRCVLTATAPVDGVVMAYITTIKKNSTDTATTYIDGVLLESTPALLDYFDGSTTIDNEYIYNWTGSSSDSTSTATPLAGDIRYTSVSAPVYGTLAWVKSRLMAALGPNVYDLPPDGTAGGGLPDPNYTNPAKGWVASSIAESPQGVLVAGDSGGNLVSILEMKLDSSGGVPILTGGSTVASLPAGETILKMQTYLGAYLIIGTSDGVRIGQFDQIYGTLTVGPLTVQTNNPVYGVGGRDRFAYCSYTNQHEDGVTGIARIDLSYVTDSSGRLAWAPDLRAASNAQQKYGDIREVARLPHSGRLCFFVVGGGVYVEGNGPSTSTDPAWLRTSRIRYDTNTKKLWTGGKVLGEPESSFSVSITKSDGTTDSHTDVDDTTGAFSLDADLETWVQVQINLGAGATLNSYEISAIPAPARQHMILCSALCYASERDRWDNVRVDPESPRTRWNNVTALEEAGGELVFTEYASDGTTSTNNVVIDQLQFQATSPPQKSDDFGGIITFKLRIVD